MAAAAEMETKVKIILVTGSVMSGIGKGIISSSLGVLLKAAGFRVSAIKIDPYLNVDAGTLSPFEHGEVFVLDDGGQVDVDLGNYERFMQIKLSCDHNITTGKITEQINKKARAGDYPGKTVTCVPHMTDAIIDWVERVAEIPVDGTQQTPHVCIVELGGTIGDMEGAPFIEAFSQAFPIKESSERFMSMHVTKFFHEKTGEIKTKPAQQGIKCVNASGLNPDLLFCRSEESLNDELRKKIASFSKLRPHKVIDVHDCANIYQVPLILYEQNVLKIMCDQLKLTIPQPNDTTELNIGHWKKLSEINEMPNPEVKIALIAKYVNVGNEYVFEDAYSSVIKALKHAAVFVSRRLKYVLINAEHLEPVENGSSEDRQKDHQEAWEKLKQCNGILVPGGFGYRGVEGKIEACQYARKNKIPFLGICLGFQCAVIDYARHVLGIKGANSTEFIRNLKPEQKVIIDMPEHTPEKHGMSESLRRGKRTTVLLTENSILAKLYNGRPIDERHRHRYEVNPLMVPKLSRAGLLFVGMGVDEATNEQSAEMGVEQRTKSAISLVDLATSQTAETNDELLEKIDKLCDKGGDGTVKAAIRMEMAEMSKEVHPFFVGVQYHPEFLSSPFNPSPPFMGLLLAATGQLNDYLANKYENCSNMEKLEQIYANALRQQQQEMMENGNEHHSGRELGGRIGGGGNKGDIFDSFVLSIAQQLRTVHKKNEMLSVEMREALVNLCFDYEMRACKMATPDGKSDDNASVN